MKVSFIVTTYNLSESQLRRCLRSLTHQELSREDYEIIVVDDESDDDPQPIVESFSSVANMHYVRQQHHRQGAARNKALEIAKGDVIRFVDGDDFLYAGTTRLLLEFLDGFEGDIIISGFKKVPSTASFSPRATANSANCQIDIYNSHQYMASHTLFGSCCVLMFRRSLLNTPLSFVEDTYIEDEEFVTRLVWRADTIITTDLVTYAYTQNDISTTHQRDTSHLDTLFSARMDSLQRIQSFASSVEGERKGLDRKVHFLAVDILRNALREPDWEQRTSSCVKKLSDRRLFPLPSADYSFKYRTFAKLSSSSIGRRILHLLEMIK